MELRVTLERKPAVISDKEELLLQELEKKARIQALQKNDRVPTIEEYLYHTTEESEINIKDIAPNAVD